LHKVLVLGPVTYAIYEKFAIPPIIKAIKFRKKREASVLQSQDKKNHMIKN